MDDLRDLAQYVPFVGLAVSAHAGKPSPLAVRLIEAVIIGCIAAGAATYATAIVNRTQIEHLNEKIGTVASQVDRVDDKIEAMRRDLYQVRGDG